MKTLEHLSWSPKWVSFLGCVKGCLDYLGFEISDAWLYGGSGHAFVINISPDACPSGPTAWRTMMLFKLAPNLGYQIDGIFAARQKKDEFEEAKRRAWDFARESIDEGLPVFGWELAVPEFYVINGYDEAGYYYSGPEADVGPQPKPWNTLGDTGIGIIEMYRIQLVPAQDNTIAVKAALENALKHASNPEEWIMDGYASGLKGFDVWIQGLEAGKSSRFGMAYNAKVWGECRRYAAGFLAEAKARLNGKASALFDEGIEHYQVVTEQLERVAEIYPFEVGNEDKAIPIDEKSQAAASLLKKARQAEALSLDVLAKIVAEL